MPTYMSIPMYLLFDVMKTQDPEMKCNYKLGYWDMHVRRNYYEADCKSRAVQSLTNKSNNNYTQMTYNMF